MRTILFLLGLLTFTADIRSAPAAAPARPNILFCFADDWGRYASIYANLETRPSINEVVKTPVIDRIAQGGRAVPQRVRHRAELHAVPQFAVVGTVFLPHGPRRDFAGGGLGCVHSQLSAAVARRGLPHRQDLQGLEPGAPADAPYGGQNYAYEKAGSDFRITYDKHVMEHGPRRHDRRGREAETSSPKSATISTPFSPTASRASRSATGSARRSRTAPS